MDGGVVRNTSIIINVEEPPIKPVAILGLADCLTSSTRHEPYCIARGSFPSSEITWSLDEENVTDNAEATTTNMASGYVMVISELNYVTRREDYGKILRCRISHVALGEDFVAEKAICLIDTEMNLSSVEGDLSGSLVLEVSGIPHSASCSLRACDIAQYNSTTRDECPERYLGDTYSDLADHVYEFIDLVASTTYEVSLRCVHRLCGESTTETRATVPSPPDRGGKNIDSENVHFENMNSEFNAESNSSTATSEELTTSRQTTEYERETTAEPTCTPCPCSLSGLSSGASAGIAILGILLVASLIIYIVQFTLLRRRTKPEFDGSKMNEKRDEVNTPKEVNDNEAYEMIQSGDRAYTTLQLDSSHSFIIARENVTFFTILGSIGRGDFGEVWKGDLRSNQHHLDVAIRQIPDRVIKSLQVLESIKALYKLSDQPNIVKCLGYCKEQGSILYEFISGGTLLTYLQTSGVQSQPTYSNLEPNGVRIDEGTLLNLAWQVAKGMQFLASKKIIHGALCAHNVLLGERKQCKISDYGLSSSLFGDLAKPTRWSSPETMATNDQTKEGDIWSFGIVLWEIMTLGARPYPKMTFTTVQTEVAKGYQMKRPHHCAQEVYAIMSSCWKKDPTSRTNFDRILKDLERILEKTHSYLSLNDLDERVYASTLDL
ncbi:angiopoietin-1 receptor-like isoform X2 [Lytechinus variegatus]|uniref:angiopoietin-1 receptor-like isoform X2 n=1 Tax=Lytechinus variegatus TaxID=7654 RepID=UPI001BB26046|nr:angiopoietin-1 receptor-like isoform X2 [Lytechinus variegatus]